MLGSQLYLQLVLVYYLFNTCVWLFYLKRNTLYSLIYLSARYNILVLIDLGRPYWILHPVSCHTPEVATTVFKCS